jgi:hypothetical protein
MAPNLRTLIRNGVLPMQGNRTILDPGSVLLEGTASWARSYSRSRSGPRSRDAYS